ncbi:MAG: glycosyltransferase family 4 protein [Anaerolineae bacterium]
MKILSIIHRYYPAVGGTETHMGTIHRMLVERGHTVTVLTTDAKDFELFWNRDRDRFANLADEHDGVKILRFPVRHLPLPHYSFPAGRLLTSQIAKLFPHTSLSKKMTSYFPHVPVMSDWLETTQEQFDVVVGTTITLEGILQVGQQFAQRKHIPFVIVPLTHLGGGARPASEPISRFYTLPQQQQIVLSADGLLAINPAEQAYYAGHGMAKEKMALAPSAPNVEELKGGDGDRWRVEHDVDADTFLVVVLSALTRDKGTIQTIEAMRQLWRNGSKAKLVLAGSPRSDFETHLTTIPAAENQQMILRGRVSNNERKDLLAAADVFCMPSAVESFGIAFAEAMVFKAGDRGQCVGGEGLCD